MKKVGYSFKKEGLLMLLCMLCLWLPLSLASPSQPQRPKAGGGLREASGAASSAGAPAQEESPRIALTFDDGPSGEHTLRLLEGLKEREVRATFFLIGKSAEKYPEIVRRLDEDGHLIGNHTYHHVNIADLSEEDAKEEIGRTNAVIAQITGKEVFYMRPPFGAWRKDLELQTSALPVMWTVDPLDWTTENADEIVNKVVTDAEDNDIILLHDCYKSSVDAAFRIIDLLKEEGFEFVTVDELLLH